MLITDLNGKEIAKFKLKDFDDRAAWSSDIASDSRWKALSPSFSSYPMKINVSYEIEKSGSLHYPIWKPQDEEKLRIMSADFKVIDRSGKGIRFHEFNVPPVKTDKGSEETIYQWEVKNIVPYEFESFNRDIEYYAPLVYTAPNSFKMEGYVGEMSSWKSLGEWIEQLNKNKNDLKPHRLTELDALLTGVKGDLEKTRIIYNYLQNNTRYVSIQLGIGGWQPFSAAYVHEKKYGDCKALSFYMKSLLEHYGVKSHYTLINAGRYAHDVNAEFPNAHFNHAILTVPVSKDTMFLECTSQTSPFGYMGTFTSNRNALLITDDGGKLIRTRKYETSENVQSTKTVIELTKEGAANISVHRIFKGLEVENKGFFRLYDAVSKEKDHWLLDKYRWDGVSLTSFELTELTDRSVPEGGFIAELTAEKEARKMGKRLFLNPGKYISAGIKKMTEEERSRPISIRYGYTQVDTIIYAVPENHRIEGSSSPVLLETAYGTYRKEIIQSQQKITVLRKFALKDGIYPTEAIDEFKAFINTVVKNDRRQIVLVNKT